MILIESALPDAPLCWNTIPLPLSASRATHPLGIWYVTPRGVVTKIPADSGPPHEVSYQYFASDPSSLAPLTTSLMIPQTSQPEHSPEGSVSAAGPIGIRAGLSPPYSRNRVRTVRN